MKRDAEMEAGHDGTNVNTQFTLPINFKLR